jgi:hypothetical protein
MKNEMLSIIIELLLYVGLLAALISGWLYGLLSLLEALP